MKRSLTIVLIVAATGLLAAQWIWMPEKTASDDRHFSEKVNLALRQVGHHLLTLECDDSTAIPPIEQIEKNEFLLKLESRFDYDTLPYLLDQAFSDYDITSEYQVALKNCKTGELVLGYNQVAFDNNNFICAGREKESECNYIALMFPKKPRTVFSYSLLLASCVLIGVLIFSQLYFSRQNKEEQKKVFSKKSELLKLGLTEFNFNNQTISINGVQAKLTYRENKLLQFFTKHPNQVLEREKILSQVWGDEGVIVGRSLDVFVSRLRKILKPDGSLKISNVHGVGYRLEVGN